MSDAVSTTGNRDRLSPTELRKLPLENRYAILEAQAKLAKSSYRNDQTLTDFEAFAEEDFHGDTSSSESR
jgi:hypothetical protein